MSWLWRGLQNFEWEVSCGFYRYWDIQRYGNWMICSMSTYIASQQWLINWYTISRTLMFDWSTEKYGWKISLVSWTQKEVSQWFRLEHLCLGTGTRIIASQKNSESRNLVEKTDAYLKRPIKLPLWLVWIQQLNISVTQREHLLLKRWVGKLNDSLNFVHRTWTKQGKKTLYQELSKPDD